MAIDVIQESILLYAKQLKIPTFSEYPDVLRQCPPDAEFADLLLELMKREGVSRQENQNKRRLKSAEFPYHKTIDEFDVTQLNGTVSQIFIQELASCQFIKNRQNIVMIGPPGRGNYRKFYIIERNERLVMKNHQTVL